jgi:hypothetical protein
MPNAHSMAIGSEGTVFVGSRRQNHRHRPPPPQRRRLQGRQPLRRRTLEDLARRQYRGQPRHLTPSRTSPKISSTVSPPGPRRPPTSGSLSATRATSPTLNIAGATPAAKPPTHRPHGRPHRHPWHALPHGQHVPRVLQEHHLYRPARVLKPYRQERWRHRRRQALGRCLLRLHRGLHERLP